MFNLLKSSTYLYYTDNSTGWSGYTNLTILTMIMMHGSCDDNGYAGDGDGDGDDDDSDDTADC